MRRAQLHFNLKYSSFILTPSKYHSFYSTAQSKMGSTVQYSTVIQPPPGPVTRPTASNPEQPTNPPTFNDAMHVRTVVFVDEQGCTIENELDEDDARSWHWVAYDNGLDKPAPVGTIRLVPPPHAPHEIGDDQHASNGEEQNGVSASNGVHGVHGDEEPYVKLTRVAVIAAYRGKGLARDMMDTAMKWAAEHPRDVDAALGSGKDSRWDGLVLVHAQVDVEAMYSRLGFVTDTNMGRWYEEGILHVGMWKRVQVLARKV